MKTITYQIKKIDPVFWKQIRRMCLEKDTTIRDFIMDFLKKAVDKTEKINPIVEFTCKCGNQKGWVANNTETEPCPMCGGIYRGKYNPKTLSIEPIELNKKT